MNLPPPEEFLKLIDESGFSINPPAIDIIAAEFSTYFLLTVPSDIFAEPVYVYPPHPGQKFWSVGIFSALRGHIDHAYPFAKFSDVLDYLMILDVVHG